MANIIDLPRQGFQAAVRAIDLAVQARSTPFLLGRPGEAKSACSEYYAREVYKASEVIVLNASTMDPVGVAGYDFPAKDNDGYAIQNKPAWFPRTHRPVIVINDYADAAPAVRAAMYGLLHSEERRVGAWELPAEAVVIVTSNRASDGAMASTIGTAEANRVMFINFEQTPAEWVESYGMEHASPEICAFMQWKPDLFNTFDPKRKGVAFASARSWAAAARLQAVAGFEQLVHILPGIVGVDVSAAFCNFLRLADELPDLQDIIDHPRVTPVPARPDAAHMVASVVARAVSPDNFAAIFSYIERMPAEFVQAFLQQAQRHCPAVAAHPAFIEWTREKDVRLAY